MISPKFKINKNNEFDALLMRCLKNWSDLKTTPVNGRQRLLKAVAQYEREYAGWRTHLLFRHLPGWLLSYLFDNTWFFGATEQRSNSYMRAGETSYSMMIFLYGVRSTVT